MSNWITRIKLSHISWVILIGALAKFSLHLYIAPGYDFFFDELYTNALSRHLAFGYVDLPPLAPALVALSRWLLGESLFAMHIFPALAGAFTLVFACLIAKEFGGKTFAVALTALGFIVVPGWLMLDSIFCYDSIDQLILAAFLFFLTRYIRMGNKRLWLVLGLIAGLACLTKMTILFMGPGFLIALLISKRRKDLLTPWPWLGSAICLLLVSPYLIWQYANQWPLLGYLANYGTQRVYQAGFQQFLVNILMYISPLLLPIWLIGLYRIFRRMDGVNYAFYGFMFLVTLALLFFFHVTPRMILALFIPLLGAGAVFMEELISKLRRGAWLKAVSALYLLVVGVVNITFSLPVIPMDRLPDVIGHYEFLYAPLKEFIGASNNPPISLTGRTGWEELAQDVAEIYNALPPKDRAVAGIYADVYPAAGAIDQFAPKYGLPNAVSQSSTYFYWGPKYSWDVMIMISGSMNSMSMFFETCEQKTVTTRDYVGSLRFYIYECRGLKVPVDKIWNKVRYLG